MNKSLEQLIEISKLNQSIDAFTPQINTHENKQKRQAKLIKAIDQEIDDIDFAIDDHHKLIKKNEQHLLELKDRLVNISSKTDDVQNTREANAVQVEEEMAKESISFTNEEIERLNNLIKKKQAIKKEKKRLLKEETAIYKDLSSQVKAEVKELKAEMAKISKIKEQLTNKIDLNILKFYTKIQKWAGDTTVVPLKDGACYGCFLKVDNKTLSKIKIEEEMITCPNCGRILYM